MKKITLKVDSRTIPLNRFVSEFMIKTIEGMVKSLRGIDEKSEKIEIILEDKKIIREWRSRHQC